MSLRLVIFDVDGTLIDSQNAIFAAMHAAYDTAELPVPSRTDILGIVGLSLHEVFAVLSPDATSAQRVTLEKAYKDAFAAGRLAKPGGGSPLYPGARAALDALNREPDVLMALATGKSRRGVTAMIEAHDLQGLFVSQQTADDHPSKPNPAMIEACLRDAGVEPSQAVMVGDTRFDMDMARAANVTAVGVTWGYHAPESLHADVLLQSFEELPKVLTQLWERAE